MTYKPKLIIGFGSYHTFPLLLAAKIMGKPIVIFEANTFLGKVNRFFANSAKVFVQFPQGDKVKLIQRFPWDRNVKKMPFQMARKKLNLHENMTTFLVFGGSQGASFINDTFLKCIKLMKEKGYDFQVIHLTGKDEEKIKKYYDDLDVLSYVKNYERDMALLYSASDFVIARAGAGTICEILYFEKPSILIPYPNASEKHQDKNADFMQEVVRASLKFSQENGDAHTLLKRIEELFRKYSFLQNCLKKYKSLEESREDFCDSILKMGDRL